MRSSAPPKALLAIGLIASLTACEPGPPDGVDEAELSAAIGAAIGDPGKTCVLLVNDKGKVLYRYETLGSCAFERATCAQPTMRSAEDLARLAAAGETEQSTCGGTSWAAGPTPRAGVAYAAVMDGERALPGREMAYRLERVFTATGF